MEIFKIIIISLVCVLFTAIIIGVVVIQYPAEFTSYLALSFAAVVDGICLYAIIPFRVRKGPNTVSKELVFWLLILLYCCFLASGFLTDAYISTAKVIILVFDCIFTVMGLAAAGVLLYTLTEYIIIKRCLKYGEETTAEFVRIGKSIMFEYGKPQTRAHRTVFKYGIVFRYPAYGREITAKSKRVFSRQEVERLQAMNTFGIKFNKRTAVVSEILNVDDE